MKKSTAVPATLVIMVASGLTTGCSGERDCLDAGGRVTASSYCRSGAAGYHYSSTPRGGFGGSGGGFSGG